MLRHYFYTAWRHLLRNKLYAGINLLGLSLGMACCILILLFVQSERAYDHYNLKGDRIFRLASELNLAGSPENYAMVSMAVGPELKERYPEVRQFTRFLYSPNKITVRNGDKFFNESMFYLADSQVFEVFSFHLLEGDARTALNKPKTVVLVQSLAKKYFGDQPALGKIIQLNNKDYQVSGVMEDLPRDTDFPIQGMMSMVTLPAQTQEVFMVDYGRTVFYTYLLFQSAESGKGFQQKLDAYSEEVITPYWRENSVDGYIHFDLTPLFDLHFRNDLEYDTPKGNASYLYIFSLVAVVILLIACFNYLNLAIAQSARRSVEVGVRKVTGATFSQLISQFLGEALLLSLLALVVAIGLIALALPAFNELAGKKFALLEIFGAEMGIFLPLVAIFTGLLAGAYPAFFLSRLAPAKVLKGQFSLKGRNWLRQGLVVVQFSISVGLIVATLIIQAQMKYMQEQDLGFKKDQVIVVEMPLDSAALSHTPQFQNALLGDPAIESVAATRGVLPGARTSALLMRVEVEGQLKENQFNVGWVDDRYVPALNISMAQGRNFDKTRGTDQAKAFVVNEAFVKQMGWKEPLGKRMQWGLMANNQAEFDGLVVGVVKDFHYASLHNRIEPLVLLYEPNALDRMVVRIQGGKIEQGLNRIRQEWEQFEPNKPLEYFFLDAYFDKQYASDQHLSKLFAAFSFITILIACMGLFGLSSFITRQRTKEIGIRKVMGAADSQILQLIWKDFVVLVATAVGIGSIGAWLVMENWLSGFAFAVHMPWLVFGIAALLAMGVALLATSFHALRAARAHPVYSLRYE